VADLMVLVPDVDDQASRDNTGNQQLKKATYTDQQGCDKQEILLGYSLKEVISHVGYSSGTLPL
jgi:hypothetical protein